MFLSSNTGIIVNLYFLNDPKSDESLSSFFILKTKGHNVSYSGYASM